MITVSVASKKLLNSGKYTYYKQADEYAICVAFRAYEKLYDVQLAEWDIFEDVEAELYYMQCLEPNKPLVADLAFAGDFTTFTISFYDSDGVYHTYVLSESGRNGELVLSPK